MKIALIDDDSAQIRELSEILQKTLETIGYITENISAFDSGEVFLSDWKSGRYDLILIDIFMKGISGVEVARRIRETDSEVWLVFCTTSNEFASESYEVNAQYYLHKPITEEKIVAMFQRLNPEIIANNQSVILPDQRTIKLRQILYTNYFNHVVTFYLKNGESCHVRISQAEAEKLLLVYEFFFSPIKGIIINFYEVEQLVENTFILSNKKTIPITRRKYKEAKNAYNQFHFNKMRKEVAL